MDDDNNMFLDKRGVARLLGLGERTIFRIIGTKGTTFPKPRKIPGLRRKLWLRDDVLRWAEKTTRGS